MNSTKINVFFNKSITTRLFVVFVLLLLASQADAKIWYTMWGGQGTKDGGSWANASDKVRQTIENASDGDEIWVAGGNVRGSASILFKEDQFLMDNTMTLSKNVKIYGGFPRPDVKANPTMADRNMVEYATIFNGTVMTAPRRLFAHTAGKVCQMDGFYVVNGSADSGAGIVMNDGLTISNCVFVSNTSTGSVAGNGGGAVYMNGGTLVNCVVVNNESAQNGAAVYLSGTAQMINCTLGQNKNNSVAASGRAAYLNGPNCKIVNTVMWNNGGVGDDVALGGGATSAQVINCAMTNIGSYSGTSLAAGNQVTSGPFFRTPSSVVGLNNQFYPGGGDCIPNKWDYSGCVSGSVFEFSILGDWYLLDARSAMFDKGDKTQLPAWFTMDIENNPRIRNKQVDIGCYELQPLTVAGYALTNPKVYDGNNYCKATGNGSLSAHGAWLVSIDSIKGRYNDRNVGTNKNITLSFYLKDADASKFFVEDTVITSGQITAKAITVIPDSIVSSTSTAEAFSKVYGSLDPTFTYRPSPALATGDVFTVGTALSRTSAGSLNDVGNYAITMGTLSAGSNYTLSLVSTPVSFSIVPKPITVTVGTSTKVYDGTTAIATPTLTLSQGSGVNQVLAADWDIVNKVKVTGGTSLFDSPNVPVVANTRTVTVSSVVISGTRAFNYKIANSASNTASNITKATIPTGPTGISLPSSTLTYDGVAHSLAILGTLPTGTSVAYTNNGQSLANTYSVSAKITGANYNDLTLSSNLVINPKELTLTGVTIADRLYSAGNVAATVSSWGALQGVVGSDNVALNTLGVVSSYETDVKASNKLVVFTPAIIPLKNSTAPNYTLKMPVVTGNVGFSTTTITALFPPLMDYTGTPKVVTATHSPADVGDVTTITYFKNGVALAGAPTDAGSYTVLIAITGANYNNTQSLSFVIAPKLITVSHVKVSKPYDGTLSSVIPTFTLNGVLSVGAVVDNVSVDNTNVIATYVSKDVKTDIVLNSTGIILKGTRAFNYTVASNFAGKGDITKRLIDPAIHIEVLSSTKIYDGNSSSTVPALIIHGLLGGDNFTAVGSTATATYDNKNVGENKVVTVSGFTFSDAVLAQNYTWAASYKNMASSITQRGIDPTIYIEVLSSTKIYDGNTTSTVPALIIHGLLGGDNFTAIGSTATYDTKDVGTNKVVTIEGIIFSDAVLSQNYTWTSSYKNTASSITRRDVDPTIYIEVGSISKPYDGGISSAIPTLTIVGLLGGDNFIALPDTATATYDNKNVGFGKVVTVRGISFSDQTLANNYTWNPTYQNAECSITKVACCLSTYIVVSDTAKIYDGTTSIGVPSLEIVGLYGTDKFTAIRSTAKATFDTKNVGTKKIVSVSGITFSDPELAANYSWNNTYENYNSEITRFPVVVEPVAKQADTWNALDNTFDYLPLQLPNNEILAGALTREPGTDVAIYEILQGSIDNVSNPNYNISFIGGVKYEILSTISMEVKWGYSLVMNNSGKKYTGYQWYKDGVAIDGATLQHYSLERYLCGSYKAKVTLADGGAQVFTKDTVFYACNKSLKHLVISPTLVSAGANVSVKLFDESNMATSNTSNYSIILVRMDGVVVSTIYLNELSEYKLQTPELTGAYIIRVFENNSELLTQKIVVY